MTTAVSLHSLETSLRENLENASQTFWETLRAETAETVRKTQMAGNVEDANNAWFLNKVAVTRCLYVHCFAQMLAGDYYEAWCNLERVEIENRWLIRNTFYDPILFGAESLQTQVTQWQGLFPYKVFFSPGFLQKRIECSICRKVRDPWSDCEHEVGRVYAGRECYRIITEAEFLEISLVSDPVQKYSVVHSVLDEKGNSIDHHDYALIRFVADRLASPFDGWRIQWTHAYHPHDLFSQIRPDDACPCESGRAYKECCQARPGVVRPHAHIEFEKDPPATLPNAALTGYHIGDRSVEVDGHI
jgi:hypothetical protein